MRSISLVTLVLMLSSVCFAQSTRGIKGKKAPELNVDKWVQLPKTPSALKKKKVNIADYKGKVVYMLFFQVHCPSCREHGFPSISKLKKMYKGDKQVEFIAIQTVNGGSRVDTPEGAKKLAARFQLEGIAVGHSNSKRNKSVFRSYKPGGTPWAVVIDKQGIVQHNDYFVDARQGQKIIDRLKKQR